MGQGERGESGTGGGKEIKSSENKSKRKISEKEEREKERGEKREGEGEGEKARDSCRTDTHKSIKLGWGVWGGGFWGGLIGKFVRPSTSSRPVDR